MEHSNETWDAPKSQPSYLKSAACMVSWEAAEGRVFRYTEPKPGIKIGFLPGQEEYVAYEMSMSCTLALAAFCAHSPPSGPLGCSSDGVHSGMKSSVQSNNCIVHRVDQKTNTHIH